MVRKYSRIGCNRNLLDKVIVVEYKNTLIHTYRIKENYKSYKNYKRIIHKFKLLVKLEDLNHLKEKDQKVKVVVKQ